ncbi:MAG: hypothetical protein E7637_08695 [Ruminococcaceae bacterium]|nr:hypothetical protein [Oscillospiraceae bacterium]
MYTYSIMPLSDTHFDEICADVRDQYERGISTCPLFKMTLVPEGNPVWDKAGPLCALYRRYREVLKPYGIKTGILIQASLGHGYTITPNPFDRYVNLSDGAERFVCCPEDERFLDHFSGVLEQLAAEHPDAIMLDDDFRLVVRPGRGCACPRHMAEFNRRAGTDLTREQLYAHIRSHDGKDRLTRIFLETQRDSLIHAATRFRAAIDRVDPSIQGINCTSGDSCESVIYTSKIFAGKGNPTIVRAANGIYAPLTSKGFSAKIRNAAVRGGKLRKHGIDIVLSETDTIPFNRYGKNARYLHAHYTASILERMKGAKHWITRFSAYEPNSGKAFRDILAMHRGFYERLADLSDEIEWAGFGSLFLEQEYSAIEAENVRFYHENEWISSVLERMGLPFYFTDTQKGAVLLEGSIVCDMTDTEICELFDKGSVFADGESASDLVARGFGDRLGVSLAPWDLDPVRGETFNQRDDCFCTKQKNHRRITIENKRVEALSHNFKTDCNECVLLSPAVTSLSRGDGKLSVVYCGTPKANFDYTEGFAFLNETRKKQFVQLMKRANVLPVYYEGDNEVCLRAGHLQDGTLLCTLLTLGFDPMDSFDLYLETPPKAMEMLLPDGSQAPVSFTPAKDGLYTVHARVEPMYPVVLLIQSR